MTTPTTDLRSKATIKAAKAGDLAVVRKLLNADRSLLHTKDKDGSTILHCATWKGHSDLVRHLLDEGAEVNAVNQNGHYGTTPLHAAAHGNQRAVAQLLIERGADVTAKNLSARTPLGETTVHNATSVAKLLREHGAH